MTFAGENQTLNLTIKLDTGQETAPPKERRSMTFWHYTNNKNLEGLGLLPGNSATDNPNLSAESARALLEVSFPTVVYPVTVDPDDPEYPVLDEGSVPAGEHGLGGGQDWYFPNGTRPGSIGPPRPVYRPQ